MITSIWFIFQDVNTPVIPVGRISTISINPYDGKHTFYNVLFQRKWDTGYPCISCLIPLNWYWQPRAVTPTSSTRRPYSPSFKRGGQERTHNLYLWASSRPRSIEPYLRAYIYILFIPKVLFLWMGFKDISKLDWNKTYFSSV